MQDAMERGAEFRVVDNDCATADMEVDDMCIDDEGERMHPAGPALDE